MNHSNKSEGAIFDAIIELPPERRKPYLREACAGDDALRQRVEALVRAHDLAGEFMRGAAVEPRRDTLAGKLAEQPGDRIGRYKLLQQIGEGGCGVVYMAEQEEPVRRRVALKVIKLGMDTKNVIARFEAERQALALMDHPNIAKVLDAGATDTGRPYFVMELVRGIKITDYCDENNLSTATRLELFVQVCQAIQHAHQKGIIHRDIKPSNILVADHDGVPVPKIIDFGIAKATSDQRLTDKTVFTAFEQFIGTPAYMSPEQARLSGLDVDTRSDIYSLGVLLYELLTAKTPFEAKMLHEMGLDEVRRIIREEEPPRPSTRLHTLNAAEQTTVAKHRQCEPPKLFGLIHGDLDWIVMKCLEKERARRYDTATGLAIDVKRHLNDEPVTACPPGKVYQFQKLVRRNRLAFVAGLIMVISLLFTTTVGWWYAVHAMRAESIERLLRERAQVVEQEQFRQRQEAETREKITRATMFYEKGNFEETEKVLDGVPIPAFQTETWNVRDVLLALANWEGGEERFRQADAHFAILLYGGTNGGSLDGRWDPQTMAYLEYAPLLAEMGEMPRYERLRDTALKLYGSTTNTATAERMMTVALLAPPSASQMLFLEKLAAVAAQTDSTDGKFAPWAYTALALFEYREGHYENCSEWSRKALSYGAFPARSSRTHLLLSMAYFKLQRRDSAEAELRECRGDLESKLTGKLGRGEWGQTGDWHDWLIDRLLFREAMKLMKTPQSTVEQIK